MSCLGWAILAIILVAVVVYLLATLAVLFYAPEIEERDIDEELWKEWKDD